MHVKQTHSQTQAPNQTIHVAHRHTHRHCIMWSNGLCSCGACYIHPAEPYMILLLSIQLFWCFVSTFQLSGCQLRGIVLWWNMNATTPFIFGRSSLTLKYWGRNRRKTIIIHFASSTSIASNKSRSSEFCLGGSCCQFVINAAMSVWCGTEKLWTRDEWKWSRTLTWFMASSLKSVII